jgi:formylglycine-generating enzyme required for sulfatase activity
LASQWLTGGTLEPTGMVWVDINDSGVSGHEGFNGQMSKYETTNAQYCQFLNAALATGDISVDGNTIYGASGSNPGADFINQTYYNLAGSGYAGDGATNGGAARINYTGSLFIVDGGFENHPVTWVTWYGATAFCNYCNYRLPTEWEWQAVADYNENYIYGCGMSINNSIANYYGSIHSDGTTVVGSLGDPSGYGYGICDMAGNVWELTSSSYSADDCKDRVVRGGGWRNNASYCTVSDRNSYDPSGMSLNVGFRVCH